MLQLNYKLTDEDYIEFNEFHQLIHSEVGKRNLFFLKLAGPMISVLAIVIFILARAEKMLIITEVIVLCIFSIVCVAQAKKIMKRGIRKTILKMKEKEEARLILLKEQENELRKKGFNTICGIDEAGRGPLAGPVVVACVIMPADSMIEGVNDSKKIFYIIKFT